MVSSDERACDLFSNIQLGWLVLFSISVFRRWSCSNDSNQLFTAMLDDSFRSIQTYVPQKREPILRIDSVKLACSHTCEHIIDCGLMGDDKIHHYNWCSWVGLSE